MTEPIVIEDLPYPVSANRQWKATTKGGRRKAPFDPGGKPRMYLTREARGFKELAAGLALVAGAKPILGPVAMGVDLWPPDDGRKHDTDNPLKCLIDALKGRCYVDDDGIEMIHVARRSRRKVGACSVRVEPLDSGGLDAYDPWLLAVRIAELEEENARLRAELEG